MIRKRSGVVIDREYLRHWPGEDHPERPERIAVLLDYVGGLDPSHFALLPPRPATRAELELCHAPDYLALVEATSKRNLFALDGDTVTCRDSFAVGTLAAGGFLRLLDAIAAGEVVSGFALVRPPGHHALSSRAMGFCLFNTIAIGARYLQRNHGASRVLIVDWDVHHGNGTQAAFYDDPSVLFISTHQFPYYPGTGAVDEVGVDAGEGYTLNVPLPAGCADAEYLRVFADVIIPAARRFNPDWILVSAGFDPHRRDPLGGMDVTEAGFGAMAQLLIESAAVSARSRVAFLLEGGYDLAALRASVGAVLAAMREDKSHELDVSSAPKIAPLIRKIHQVHEKYR
jgi:acetoin utilization deacetylase AcuC-like enzyme